HGRGQDAHALARPRPDPDPPTDGRTLAPGRPPVR
ncbi:MAG: hypothetical protein L3J68_04850, partial [Thermoplasmata archaeon]|nr:hypothetical protein [Thermoplasmata archaeon]